MEYEGSDEIVKAWFNGLKPDSEVTVSQWADKYRILSTKSSSEPGKWMTSRTPYLREIMDCLSPSSPVERVVFMKCAQVGGTECGNNWIGFCIHSAPAPMMFVLPTVELAKRISKQRIDSLIEETDVLSSRIAPARSRDSGNTILSKDFPGGILILSGANSAVSLRSMPIRYLFLDDVDGYPYDLDNEGDPIKLAEARTRTFARKKIFIVSTPTISGISRIESEYNATDQCRYFLPCPYCGYFQYLKFEKLDWDWGHPDTVGYICESCNKKIYEDKKTEMLSCGEWRSTNKKETSKKIRGFHLSALYSPVGWRSWVDIADLWESSQKSATKLKSFKNIELGETWVEEGDSPDEERLIERLESYPIGRVQNGALLLVCGVDVQKDRLEASVWSFGRGKECWLVEHRVISGDTSSFDVWNDLNSFLNEVWEDDNGVLFSLSRIAVDTGYNTQNVYSFIRKIKDNRIMAIKGVSKGHALVGMPTAIDININGKRISRGIKLFPVASSIAKLEFYNNLQKNIIVDDKTGEISFPDGYVHIPKIDVEYIKQLCSEQLVTRYNRNGFPIREWQKMRDRNEALDCYVYARAAVYSLGIDRFTEKHWQDLERKILPDDNVNILDNYSVDDVSIRPRKYRRKVVKSSWITKTG